MSSQSKNQDSQRREENGIVYFDRGVITGRDGKKYERYAIQTHFVQKDEDQAELVRRYVMPLYKKGDILSFGAKVMCMCVGSVRTRNEVKPGFWANLLWRFAGINSTGVGMHEPYKLQLVIDICGLPRVLLAVFCAAVTKPFGVKGVFYKVCGKGVGGIDGFYFRSSFETYKQMALINPSNPKELCDKLSKDVGIPVVLMDANDIEQNELGCSDDMPLTYDQRQDAMKDNPSGQGDELTPLILIRPID
ncbi:MAG: F420-0--gamma-glutamyl ligase [Eubacteriales bacterium]|nr:F420-0--gamma-glutamyl ligase [Eubacteriales bacterium]MDD3882406.1 F420-0--gamma-glutamyl ligase [Eubacteriales bacterium]MDD4512373.1 F420-0--gamma-glutamyl ligase [Eubacteriales bacterium]